MSDSVERFSNRVENYVKYRPDYPREIIRFLAENCRLTPASVVADVGCGTGISSRMFLENGCRVIGVEPNAAMRDAAVEQLAEYPGFSIVDSTSTATTLPEASVDLVTAAQAFHWFDPVATRPEFARILKPNGYVVLIWNIRQLDTTPFLIEYEAFLQRFGNDYNFVRHENITDREISAFFGKEYGLAAFPNVQIFDFEGLKGRMLSSSYMPTEKSANYAAMIEELRLLFAKHAESGRIEVFYDTNVYFSQL